MEHCKSFPSLIRSVFGLSSHSVDLLPAVCVVINWLVFCTIYVSALSSCLTFQVVQKGRPRKEKIGGFGRGMEAGN